MPLPNRSQAHSLLKEHVKDEYQLYHALMVATAMDGYARLLNGKSADTSAAAPHNPDLWYITGLLHDIDFEEHPDSHPAKSLAWFREWGYPEELVHAVEAHAYNYNGFTTLPQTRLAAALIACDEISGIFYAYRKLNPIPYKDMKASSIKKRLGEKAFAAKIDRATIARGTDALGVTQDEHVANLIRFFAELK